MNCPSQAEVQAHHDRVARLGCLVHGCPSPTIHHCHSGSMADNGWVRGWAQRGVSHALVIPICASLHTAGPHAIDGSFGVRSWEALYGAQMDFLHEVSESLGYDVFELAIRWGYVKKA